VCGQDVALLGLASMLYQCNMLDEAVHVTILAMDLSPDVVAVHFMLANLYAAKVCSEAFLLIFRVAAVCVVATDMYCFQLSFFSVWKITHEPLHLAQ